ncbi:regulator of volume decrease after cellular swelling-domain-containing protein [Amylocarpus encephaloides]|uniref:Regulator of volume decrease after cellular swelling-domain-containing protein n=1 Tax=Amylocarpus encephaloides TaxID=45428 RepID=A0A9P7YEE0_9HELO|nr:regulator of volume decrease after cellular swelling-domain-containing protein [Amylocarpus encephaloides]
MPPTTIHSAPALDTFTTLVDHQTQTPTHFFGTKPVLHYHATRARAVAPRNQISKLPLFADGEAVPSEAAEAGSGVVVELVDVFVSSETLTLFNPSTSTGLSIPYPAISLHAIQRLDDHPSESGQQIQGLYMNLDLVDPNAITDDDEEPVELTLIPPPSTSDTEPTTSVIQSLFEAVSNCSNLHPDLGFQDDEEMADGEADSRIVFEGSVGYEGISGLPGVQQGATGGGLPPPFPGSGGWITAENVSVYFDADGNWIGEGGGGPSEGQSLGEGAGRVRPRDEIENNGGVNGHGELDSDDNKRVRTD